MSSPQKKAKYIRIRNTTRKPKKKMPQSIPNDEAKVFEEEDANAGHRISVRPANAQNGSEHQRLSLISPEVRSIMSTPAKQTTGKQTGFSQVTFQMINYLSKSDPDLAGWADDGQHFYVSNHKHLDRLCNALKPFFAHGNFSSFRRQLSAYNFTRKPDGRYQGYWYHPLFHQLSNEQDLRDIQSSRRRRGSDKSHKALKPAKPKRPPSIDTSGSVKTPRGFIDYPEPEGIHTLVLDSMASLFPLASLVQDEILNGGTVENDKGDTPGKTPNSQKGVGMKPIESRTLSSFISCTPIKPNPFAFPFLPTTASPTLHQGDVTGFNFYEKMDENKENSVEIADQATPYQLGTGQYSPLTPVNYVYQGQRSPFAYDGGFARLFCSPNRQQPAAILANIRKPVLFSFRGNLPVVETASTRAQQAKKSPTESESKPEAQPNSIPENL